MKKIIFTYGAISGGITISILTISILFWDPENSHFANSQWFGYLIMIVALSLIFFGVKSYRDDELGGIIGFWDATKVGLGIALVASLVYVLGWEIYVNTSGSNFMEIYADSYLEQMRVDGATDQEIARMQKQ